MTPLQGLFSAISAVILFLYGLQGFSGELQAVGGEALQAWLGRVTANRWRGFLVAALATAVVQSSSAVTALAVTLVDASVISFRASLGVLLGANVGTTATAWLVSFKLTGIGPMFIVLGSLISILPIRAKVVGKAIFYFGLVFFALDLISTELKPLQNRQQFKDWLALAEAPWMGVLAGLVFTALVQSSSVTTGLAILLVQQGVLPPEAAIPIVIGSNVGSTSTALIAGLGMSPVARATAITNFLFNAAGVLVYFPFLRPFSRAVVDASANPGMAVAWAHLIFNLTVALVLLLTLNWIEPPLRSWLRVDAKSPRPASVP
ncbi:Na/Pi-cotransporter [Paraburkholderia sp. BL23I1N1]|uniref:Na/Pi cotransporter family protein n=1 Tax=Paraburkholderia sp. BL23I1N1 TaxID=1938802 RepID=UPI000E75C393|nr:Na/Pi symporter [Paraburkholderia sp. BL23I1N1]RKE39451.1 Na/Pi-cotransporter [Paraburkholderia sp. BL23I1N1]